MACQLFCMGNPLLDIQVRDGTALLKKYDLKANDAILAEEKHMPIYEELVESYIPTYVAGGAAQNAARGAAYVCPPDTVVYTGCVGDDALADQLRAANKREGLDERYLVKKGAKTGACAVVLTGHNRSLVTTLRAAEMFEESHLSSPGVIPLVESAKVFYVEGFFLTHGTESVLELTRKSSGSDKVFALNLSAPFIAEVFFEQLEQVLRCCDIVIGNDDEAEAYAKASGLSIPEDRKGQDRLVAIAQALAASLRAHRRRGIVIFTCGSQPTVLVSGEGESKIFEVTPIEADLIVDTNGAGDAFAGGFMGAFVMDKCLDDCVKAGHKLAAMSVQLIGPQYKWPKVSIFEEQDQSCCL